MKKRLLAIFLTLAMALALFPVSAWAADAPWAQSAVDALNGIYGSSDSNGPFSASDTVMTEQDLSTLLTATGWTTDVPLSSETPNPSLTRGTACTVLADVFGLPIGDHSAIQYLFDQNIINGESTDNLNESGTVTHAQFAVLAYRVLNFTGGGMGSSNTVLKPGTEEYFAWMYLAARRCVPFQSNAVNTPIGTVDDFTTYDGLLKDDAYTDDSTVIGVNTAEKSGEGIWNAWVSALSEPKIGGLEGFDNAIAASTPYNGEETMIETATHLMGAFIAQYEEKNGVKPAIFTDVEPGDWWYDGVMYSFDAGYISGLGNGTFEPETRLPLYEFAVLLYRIHPAQSADISGVELPFLTDIESSAEFSEYEKTVMNNENVQKAMKTAVALGYLSWKDGSSADFDPTATVSRQDAAADLLKACAGGKNVDLSLDSVNTDILDRFADKNAIEEDAAPYLAYAVSHGMLSGTANGNLDVDGSVTRAQAGVLLYRTLIGLDQTKMHDYPESLDYVLPTTATEEGN